MSPSAAAGAAFRERGSLPPPCRRPRRPISIAGDLATDDGPPTMPTSPPQVPYAAGDPAARRHNHDVGITRVSRERSLLDSPRSATALAGRRCGRCATATTQHLHERRSSGSPVYSVVEPRAGWAPLRSPDLLRRGRRGRCYRRRGRLSVIAAWCCRTRHAPVPAPSVERRVRYWGADRARCGLLMSRKGPGHDAIIERAPTRGPTTSAGYVRAPTVLLGRPLTRRR